MPPSQKYVNVRQIRRATIDNQWSPEGMRGKFFIISVHKSVTAQIFKGPLNLTERFVDREGLLSDQINTVEVRNCQPPNQPTTKSKTTVTVVIYVFSSIGNNFRPVRFPLRGRWVRFAVARAIGSLRKRIQMRVQFSVQ